MKSYKNARDVLPPELLKAVQTYAEGMFLYIPIRPEEHKHWGEATQTRTLIARRNEAIREAYQNGTHLAALTEEYHLAEDTLRKIIYRKRD